MFYLLLLVAFLWCVRITRNILSYIRLWYEKEYRVDRMLIHLRTDAGKRIMFIPFRKPGIYPKTVTLFFLTFFLLMIAVYKSPGNILIRLLMADLATFPITFILVLLFQIPTKLYHLTKINQAVAQLRAYPPMIVVGVTGSFAKTSVKENTATILETRFKVIKTQASKNSPIGITETVLKGLTDQQQIFVVEMGAYKKGEIAQMSRMVRPQIGVITAINAQHQDLFQTLENTMKAKYELIQGLHGLKIGIFNWEDPRVRTLSEWAARDHKKVWYFSKKHISSQIAERVFTYADIESTLQDTRFTISEKKEQVDVRLHLLGRHQAANVTAAIAAAVACGMSLDDAAKAATLIRPAPHVMQPLNGLNGALFIDDTFNNNPDAAKAAIDVLALARGRKILVIRPMIELGQFCQTAHEEIGEHAARVCDDIILTNFNYSVAFQKGVNKIKRQVPVSILPPHAAANYIRKIIGKDDIVLFKGNEAARVLELFIHHDTRV